MVSFSVDQSQLVSTPTVFLTKSLSQHLIAARRELLGPELFLRPGRHHICGSASASPHGYHWSVQQEAVGKGFDDASHRAELTRT